MAQETTVVAGRLVDAGTGAPVEGAFVAIPALDYSTLSDASGTFRLAGVPAGRHVFEVRHIAYGTRTSEVRVRGGGTFSLQFRLEPTVLEVAPLEVEVEWRPAYLEQVGFYDRRLEDVGQFYDPAFVRRWAVGAWATASKLIGEIILARPRPGIGLGCGELQVIIDGRLDRSGRITTLSSSRIGAVEVYDGAYKIPQVVRDAGGDPFCTTVIIWTRRWLNEYELERRRIVLCEPERRAGRAPLVVEGTVTDALTDVILPRSAVTVWVTGPDGTRSEETTTADDGGRYRFCDLNPEGIVRVRAVFAGLSGQKMPVAPSDTASVTRDLTVPISQPGHLAGRVLDGGSDRRERGGGHPAAGARITLEETGFAATSDEDGFFEIRGLSPGDYRLAVSHPERGLAADSISILSGSTTDIRAELGLQRDSPDPPILATRRDPRLEVLGFYARREAALRRGRGRFFTRAEIEALAPARVTDLIEAVPALRETCGGRGCRIVSSSVPGCARVPVYLDGAAVIDDRGSSRGEGRELDRLVAPEELAAVEVYDRPVSLPGDFAPASNRCGSIILWSGGT